MTVTRAMMSREDWIKLEHTAEGRLLDIEHDNTRTSSTHPTALLVTAVLGDPCITYQGGWTNVISIKNKQDFADIHGYNFFFTTDNFDNELFGAMNKIAVLRHLAYQHKDDPSYAWFWWLDQDTLFANITHDIPWQRYGDADLVLWTPWGPDRLLADKADPVGMQSSVCHWSTHTHTPTPQRSTAGSCCCATATGPGPYWT